MIKIYLPVKPKAVQSTRFSKHHCYASKDVVAWKKEILFHLKSNVDWLDKPVYPTGPIGLVIEYCFALPKKPSKDQKNLIAENLPVFKDSRPDNDNLTKGLKDCMSGIIYGDDCQVVFTVLTKVYTEKDGINIRVISDVRQLNALHESFYGGWDEH